MEGFPKNTLFDIQYHETPIDDNIWNIPFDIKCHKVCQYANMGIKRTVSIRQIDLWGSEPLESNKMKQHPSNHPTSNIHPIKFILQLICISVIYSFTLVSYGSNCQAQIRSSYSWAESALVSINLTTHQPPHPAGQFIS